LAVAACVLVACSGGSELSPSAISEVTVPSTVEDTPSTEATLSEVSAEMERYLLLVDWSRYWLAASDVEPAGSAGPEQSSTSPIGTALHVGTEPPTSSQVCFETEGDAAWVDGGQLCPGDWTGFRGDSSNSASAGLRFDSTAAPREVNAIDLGLMPRVDTERFLSVASPSGTELVALIGSHLERWGPAGRVWASSSLGWGQVLAVDDLDGDGRDEVLFSTIGNSAPGSLKVVSFDSGEILWELVLAGVEFGVERGRFALVDGPKPNTLTMLFGLTYSPSIWRIDFGTGDAFGSLVWKSEHIDYDSPDKAPVLVDTDGDGTDEVVVDSLSALYVLDLRTGAIRSKITYAEPVPSFDGPLLVLDGDAASPVVVTISNSVYSKQVSAIGFSNGVPAVRWHREWDMGLPNSTVDVAFAPHLLRSPDGRDFLAWSVTPKGGQITDAVTEVVDARTGLITQRLVGRVVAGALRLPGTTTNVLVTGTGTDIEVLRIVNGNAALLDSYPTDGSPEVAMSQAWETGDGVAAAPSLLTIGHADARVDAVVLNDDGAMLPAPNWPEGVSQAVHLARGGIALIKHDGTVELRDERFSATGVTAPLDPQASVSPIVADLDADGRREMVLPFGTTISALRFTEPEMPPAVDLITEQAPDQIREGFFVPVVGFDPVAVGRVLVGFDRTDGIASLFGWAAHRGRLWLRPMPGDVWEPKLGVTPGSDKVYIQHSRSVDAIQVSSGELDWQVDVLSECTRSLSFIELAAGNRRALVAQAASRALFIDTDNGQRVLDQQLAAPYGGYTATAIPGSTSRWAFLGGAGGEALLSANGEVVLDAQISVRKVESIPPVIVSDATISGGFSIASVSGTGVARILTPAGEEIRRKGLGLRVNTITGALVDGDDVTDLLISTADGNLAAVSGATLDTIWTIDLEAPSGPAVVTDLNADGQTEIVIVSGNGVLHLLVGRSG
jgi:outer membrane protein assembly factor BamB